MTGATRPGRTRAGLLVLAFLVGGAVLLQELLAAGWIAPLHGSGIDVWAAILSVSLLALAVGAWIGSRTARRGSVLVPLVDLVALGAALLLTGAFFVSRTDTASPMSLLVAALILLFLPLVVFGVLSPWIVERYAATGVGPGRAAGRTYAIGTVGSALGALLGGFVLVPEWGLRFATSSATLALPAGGLLAAVLVGRSPRRALVLLVLVLLLVVGLDRTWEGADREGPFGLRRVERVDGWYGRHDVLEDDVARYLLVDGILQTSALRDDVGVVTPGDLLRAGNALELVVWMRPDAGRALVVGLGGAAFPRRLEAAGWNVEAVEIDPVVADLARRHFGVRLPVSVEDGRGYLNRSRERFDLIVLDVYCGEHLPGHLFTEEAFARLRTRLTDDGLLAVNLIGTAAGPDVLSVLRSVHRAFPNAQLHAPDGGRALGPLTLFASASAVERPSSRDRAEADGVAWPTPVVLEGLPWQEATRLLDDRNPLNLMRRKTAALWRERSRRRFAFDTD